MKNCTKKLVSFVLVAAMSLAISIPGFAKGDTNSLKDSGVKDSSEISYISEADAILLAEKCIVQQIKAGSHCPWNSTTKIRETVKFYDFNEQVNAYLFRLITRNEKQGYVFVDANRYNPCVQAFGYDCNFMLDQANMRNTNRVTSSNNHIIYGGGLTFLKKDNDSKVKNVLTNSIENYSLDTLEQTYQKSILNFKSVKAKEDLNQLIRNTQVYSQEIYDSDDVDNIWKSKVYVTGDFSQANDCAPTACTSFIYYWSHARPNPKIGLWGGRSASFVESALYSHLKTNIATPGTLPENIIPGLSAYSLGCGLRVKGSDERVLANNFNWTWFTANIHNNIPIIITVALDPIYQQHVMLAVGYQTTSTGAYLRVADGWARSYSNFYKITDESGNRLDHMIHGCYTRW